MCSYLTYLTCLTVLQEKWNVWFTLTTTLAGMKINKINYFVYSNVHVVHNYAHVLWQNVIFVCGGGFVVSDTFQ